MMFLYFFFFFFSSRRRHTRLQGDWSSDVCSSDLDVLLNQGGQEVGRDSTTVFFIIPLGDAPAKIGKLNHEPAIRIRFALRKILHGVYLGFFRPNCRRIE